MATTSLCAINEATNIGPPASTFMRYAVIRAKITGLVKTPYEININVAHDQPAFEEASGLDGERVIVT